MRYLSLLQHHFHDLNRETKLVIGGAVAIVLLVGIVIMAINAEVRKLSKKRQLRESDLVQLMTLQQRYMAAKAVSSRLSNRLASTRADDSPGKMIEEIGIKGKSSQITPVKGERLGNLVEDSAEVKLEALTANEAVNLLYRLENGTRPVIIKKACFKTRFDDPSRVDVGLTIALLKSAPQDLR